MPRDRNDREGHEAGDRGELAGVLSTVWAAFSAVRLPLRLLPTASGPTGLLAPFALSVSKCMDFFQAGISALL